MVQRKPAVALLLLCAAAQAATQPADFVRPAFGAHRWRHVTMMHEGMRELRVAEELGAEVLRETVNETHAEVFVPVPALPGLRSHHIAYVLAQPDTWTGAALEGEAGAQHDRTSDDPSLPSPVLNQSAAAGAGPVARRQLIYRRGAGGHHHQGQRRDPHKGYRSNTEMEAWVKSFTSPQRCGHMARAYSIGNSVNGFPLWVVEISDKPQEAEAEPAFKYSANMHGDEPLGRELLMRFAEFLCRSFPKSGRPQGNNKSTAAARRLVEDMRLHMLLAMNPDGFERHNRGNANGVDLNRNFPDPYDDFNVRANGGEQPETAAVMRWAAEGPTHFVAGANFHEGAVVANYPLDGSDDKRTKYAAAPDDSVFQRLAREYARHTAAMRTSARFKDGITNGAQWYPVYGGMQDWNYFSRAACLELTVELDNMKWPPGTKLDGHERASLESLLRLPLSLLGTAARGRLRDPAGAPVVGTVHAHQKDKWTSFLKVPSGAAFGDYYRLLMPGKYWLTAEAAGYRTVTKEVLMPAEGPAQVDFEMVPLEAGEVAEPSPASSETPLVKKFHNRG